MGLLKSKIRLHAGSLLRTTTLLALLSLIPYFGFAQNVNVKGTVYDETGTPAVGVNIVKKGTAEGTITDWDGNFEISAKKGDVLVFSYIGYSKQEITYNGQAKLDVRLAEDSERLDEVIVVGYGTMKKSDLTGAISSVNVDELASRATTNPAEALQGKVSGVNIQKVGGNAGAGVEVKIRGVKSFGDNEPLYIIDGFPGSINNVNPQDIAAMEVLKDGAAAAIYGSVAANGVIIVTTKNGKKGELKVDLTSFLSYTEVANQLELLDANGYVQVHKQMYDNYNLQYPNKQVELPGYITNPGSANTNWQDEVFRSGFTQNYMLSVRGGSENARYSVSYNHADEKGILIGNNYRQDNARMKLSVTKNIFDLDANLSFRATDSKQPQYSLKEVYMISPLVSVYDDSKEYGYGLTDTNGLPSNRNVIADNHFRDSKSKSYYIDANAAVTAHITDWLSFKTAYSYRGAHSRSSYHTPPYIADIKAKQEYPYHSESSSYWQEQVIDNILTFDKRFGEHSLNVMVGNSVTMQDYNWNSVAVEGKTTVYEVKDGKLVTTEKPGGFLDPNFATINAGKGGTYTGEGSLYEYRRVSLFGRLNYVYAGKYMVQATFRRDGSSKFGSDSRWGFFPSVALGWRISEEGFFPQDGLVSNLKLRASWGRLGNEQALGYYDFQALISTYNNLYGGYVQGTGSTPWPGSIAMGLANRNLQWETTDTKNIGFDYGFLNGKLSGAINYYYNKTEDMLITKKLAPSVGLWNPVMNVGKIRNTGVEVEINWADKKGDFDYNIGLNFTTTSNKVLELSDPKQALYGEGLKYGSEHFPTQTRVGNPIAGFYLYRADGIFQSDAEVAAHKNANGQLLQPNAKPGDIRFLDTDGDGSINEDDKEYCGSGIPKVEANLSFGASYKGFDFSFLLGGAFGAKIYNANRYFYEGMNSGSNFLTSTLDAWTPQNTNTDIPRAILQDPNNNSRESDRFLEKGDFVRMRQMQLGYTLPSALMKKAFIDRLRVYVSAENLFTITGYSGTDPEFSRKSSSDQTSAVLNAGVDKFVYPFTRSYVVGLQLTF
ncbi:TonB-linked SusC/RagA family outer membrane protein [Parabacteroides sp. PF5-5]|uniref:SusC/RagA family TonB-linked outer membrane protein n=1 Tax=unclassified Parabacteroides TaxID=2649774 RepID=UPI002474419A|nr:MULTISPECIES: TonB-dependent receptor [unclassified Parabacteroides]MDH6305389.1 TonB-linked SusC/RagA family outer membrane protein [Parabacteroides sp. PH5-39]MDH6316099.1 TonB-linked SusC/RagA family outer membrane protein [Parabacteroides sp. PF5-13]MDH6320249.1 TonB-linked SusC/RagA family outer membrane protein [Parabacteroides sp. PH5-13]MDH6323979.1 TonB-linked SusC/RagA family outer membrane protein [Parabacteroides sp. PH5-8]MDH6327290.1 TonB-linked SusC/RagA family outer membrane